MDASDFVDRLDVEPAHEPVIDYEPDDAITDALTPDQLGAELLVDRITGKVRQAGTDLPDGHWTFRVKHRAERSLYAFSKLIMRRSYLTAALHKPGCDWLQRSPPLRKGMLWPREHAKSTLVAQILPIHILIQPKDHNVYFPGEDGAEQRIVLTCEARELAQDALRVQRAAWMTNDLLRAFWPHRCWNNPRAEAAKWNDSEYNVRRVEEWPDPSVRALGVDSQLAGKHPSGMIDDDLVTLEAANSPTVMQTTIDWYEASWALINRPTCLRWTIGTHWANWDLYTYLQEHDPTIEWNCRAVIEDGKPIYPEGGFTPEKIMELSRKPLFQLNYMNNPKAREYVDFLQDDLRTFKIVVRDSAPTIVFTEDSRDVAILKRVTEPAAEHRPDPRAGTRGDLRSRGLRVTPDALGMLTRRNEYLRVRAR
jgi:hypothetical protein